MIEDPAPVAPEVRRARGREPLPFRALVDPAYPPVGGERAAFFEGCLSVPARLVGALRLTGAEEDGRALDEVVAGWPARIVRHETDHLGGTPYLDWTARNRVHRRRPGR